MFKYDAERDRDLLREGFVKNAETTVCPLRLDKLGKVGSWGDETMIAAPDFQERLERILNGFITRGKYEVRAVKTVQVNGEDQVFLVLGNKEVAGQKITVVIEDGGTKVGGYMSAQDAMADIAAGGGRSKNSIGSVSLRVKEREGFDVPRIIKTFTILSEV